MEVLCQRIERFFLSNKKITGFLISLYLFMITFVICMQSPMNPFHVTLASVDSSVFHYVATVMKQGGAIYRDTFDHKGPLLYFINYVGLFISYYSGAWFLEFCTLLASNICVYKTARLFCNKISACFVVFLSSTALIGCFFGGNFPECYALPCITGALYIFTDYYVNRVVSPIRLILCGSLFFCAVLLKPNTVSVWIVFCLSVCIHTLYQKKFHRLIYFILYFLIGCLIILTPVFLYLLSLNLLTDFFNTYFLFNFRYSGDSGLSAAIIVSIKCITRELVFPCMLITFFLAFQEKNNRFYWTTYLIYLVLSVLLCSMSGNDYVYYRISLIPCYTIPIAMFLGKIKVGLRQKYALLTFVIIGSTILVQQWSGPVIHMLSAIKNTTTEIDLGDEHHRELFRLIETYTKKDEPFIVYGNENSFYFYSHRFAASRYSFQYPIILVDETIRHDFFHELDEKKPKLILVQTLWCNDKYIQSFLKKHPYKCITDFDDYALYLRTEKESNP